MALKTYAARPQLVKTLKNDLFELKVRVLTIFDTKYETELILRSIFRKSLMKMIHSSLFFEKKNERLIVVSMIFMYDL